MLTEIKNRRSIRGYGVDNLLVVNISKPINELKNKIDYASFSEKELKDFIYELKISSFEHVYSEFFNSLKRRPNYTGVLDDEFHRTRKNLVSRFCYSKNRFSPVFSIYYDYLSQIQGLELDITVRLLEKMALGIYDLKASSKINVITFLALECQKKEIELEIKDVFNLKNTQKYNDLLFANFDLPYDMAKLNNINFAKMTPQDAFEYAQYTGQQEKMSFHFRRSLIPNNRKIINFLEDLSNDLGYM
jgi:hypothetical protein